MADNEKLDNQRLKNFKNKGRDLEVKVAKICVLAFVCTAAALSLAPRLRCDVVSNLHHGQLCCQKLARAFRNQCLLEAGIVGSISNWFRFIPKPCWV